jgi:eukaryotic-like serine/threonine-protein kinase
VNAAGISDSLVGSSEPIAACRTCGSEARVAGGACLGCLLRGGLEPGEETDIATFDALLAEIDIPDHDWRLGNYHILEEIGRGGMGVIYRARQRHSKRIVALKRVLSYHGDSRQTLERFRHEAEAAASLDHPNILPIYEVGEAEGLPFFTMKYACGGSLQHAAAALKSNPRECIRLLAKITRAVAYAHSRGILHRDLKPGNVLLDAFGEPLVSDFGLAKWMDADSDLTRSLAVFGTPGFIAPEQARMSDGQVGPPSDIYSLGAILFHLLTGRPPFLGEHAIAVIRQAAERPAPRLRTLLPEADRDLETICAKCLDREPQARYRSAAALAEDLERWLEGRPIVARPVAPPVRLWRWSKRNPVLAGTAALCLLTATLAGMWQIERWALQREVSSQIAAQHSIEVTPLLDLDAATFSPEAGRRLAAELMRAFESIGPATVTTTDEPLGPGAAIASCISVPIATRKQRTSDTASCTPSSRKAGPGSVAFVC